MKALVKFTAAEGAKLIEVPIPSINKNDVLIKIRKTSICGTDCHINAWDLWAQRSVNLPLILGHEFVGVVVACGDDVRNIRIGDPVSGEGHIMCNECRNCRRGAAHVCPEAQGLGVHRQGCFAEYLALPARNVRKIPDSIPDHVACIFDPLGNAIHAALSFNTVGEDVLIYGAGPIGLMALAITKYIGARHIVIVDVNEYRLNLARTLGAARSVNIHQEHVRDVMTELGIENGFHVGLEMSGSPQGLHITLDSMKHGGQVAVLGLPSEPISTEWNTIILKGLIIKGIYGREIDETWCKMMALLTSGFDVTPIITHGFPATEFEKAFTLAESAMCGKIIMDWEV